MLIVAERINTSRRSIAEAVASGNAAFIQREAEAQAQAGADYIDVNAGTFLEQEADKLAWIIDAVQAVTDRPLCLDSASPDVLAAVLPRVGRPPMLNSVTLESDRLERVLPLAIEAQAKLIALCQSPKGPAETAEAKVLVADQLVEAAAAAGFPIEDLYVDPLVFPLATNTASALETLQAIETIRQRHPAVHTICGLTNVSYGLPARKLVNRTFLTAAVLKGLDAAILDPTDARLIGALKAALLVTGQDEYGMGFIQAFKQGSFDPN